MIIGSIDDWSVRSVENGKGQIEGRGSEWSFGLLSFHEMSKVSVCGPGRANRRLNWDGFGFSGFFRRGLENQVGVWWNRRIFGMKVIGWLELFPDKN